MSVGTAIAHRRGWFFWVGLAISLGCIAWAVLALDWRQVGGALRQAHWSWLLLAAAAVLLRIAVRAARWRSLFAPPRPGYLASLTALLVGQTLNYAAPAWAGDVMRAYMVGWRDGQSKSRALGTVVVDKFLDLALFLCFLALLSLCMELPDWLALPARALGIMALVGLAVLVLGVVQPAQIERPLKRALRPLPAAWQERGLGLAGRLLDGLAALRSPTMLAQASFWSLWLWGCDTVAHYAALRALGVRLPLLVPLFLSTALRATFAVSAMPGQVAVYEGIVVMSLSLFGGVDPVTAFSVGLLRHVVDFIPPALITLPMLVLWRPRQSAAVVNQK